MLQVEPYLIRRLLSKLCMDALCMDDVDRRVMHLGTQLTRHRCDNVVTTSGECCGNIVATMLICRHVPMWGLNIETAFRQHCVINVVILAQVLEADLQTTLRQLRLYSVHHWLGQWCQRRLCESIHRYAKCHLPSSTALPAYMIKTWEWYHLFKDFMDNGTMPRKPQLKDMLSKAK